MSLSFDRIASTYDENRGGLRRGRAIAEHLLSVLRSGSVLEVGIGTGVVARGLQESGREVIGVDIAEQMLKQAKDRCGPVVAKADASCLPFADAAFENVLFVWVLQVVGDRRAAFAEAARVLTPGGRCVVVPTNRFDNRDPMAVLIEEVRSRLMPHRGDAYDLAALQHEAAGALRYAETAPGEVWSYQATPADDIRRIQARNTSWLWDLSDADWAKEIEPLLDRLRALPAEAHERRSANEIYVFER